MDKNKFLIIGAFIIALVIVIIVILVVPSALQKVDVITERTEYKIGEALKVKIENNLRKNICFSSCFPYYLEKKEEDWESYPYGDCPDTNLVENCIESGRVKAFELELPSFISDGFHRLAIPACLDCSIKQAFKEEQKFYSNDFIIK